jgi:hypothetical protein
MKTHLLSFISTTAVLSASVAHLSAAPSTQPSTPTRVEVTFVDPDKFTDAADGSRGSDWGRDGNLDILKKHLERRASRALGEGQRLVIKITDVDLAGEVEPWRGPRLQDVRIVKDIYPPRIDLSFQLLDAAGGVLKEGTRHLTDMSFLMNVSPIRKDARVYEEALLDDWVRSEFRSKK